jgi:hypothetical protein
MSCGHANLKDKDSIERRLEQFVGNTNKIHPANYGMFHEIDSSVIINFKDSSRFKNGSIVKVAFTK